MLLVVTKLFLHHCAHGMIEPLRQDSIIGAKAWVRLLHYAIIRPGISRKIAGPWAQYFLPGFYPWNVDDRALIALADSHFAGAKMPNKTVMA